MSLMPSLSQICFPKALLAGSSNDASYANASAALGSKVGFSVFIVRRFSLTLRSQHACPVPELFSSRA